MSMKVLYTDIETSPIVAHVWGLRDLNVGLNQIIKDPFIMGVGWGWDGKPAKYTGWLDDTYMAMLKQTWGLLDEADVVVHYNGDRFDVPWIMGEFARHGLTPPSPFKSLDLFKVVKKNFRFPSFKLDYVAGALLGEHKLPTGGHQLWVDCLNGDERALKRMARYCKRDVNLLPRLHTKLLPWIGNQYHPALYEEAGEDLTCQKCGKTEHLIAKGTAYTATRAYPQYWCKPSKGGCGGWTRDVKSSWSVATTGATR